MPTANWDTLVPTPGTPGNSYEFGIDIYQGAAWVNIPDITALDPKFNAKVRQRSSYAAKGQTLNSKYADDVVVTFNIEQVRDAFGQYQPELGYLLDLAAATGLANMANFRFFDTLGADWAWSGKGSVAVNRQGTGDDEAAWYAVTITGYGKWTRLQGASNPVTAAAVAGIISASPAAVAVGGEVILTGVRFTGATAVNVGATPGTSLVVLNDRLAKFNMPAGAAGVTYITLTTPAGVSLQLPYTRGA